MHGGRGRALPELIREEIKAREGFILCDSPNAQTSKWVQEEVTMIQAMEGKVFRTVDLSKELETELHKLAELSKRSTVFLSYARPDHEAAERIQRALLKHDCWVSHSLNPIHMVANHWESL